MAAGCDRNGGLGGATPSGRRPAPTLALVTCRVLPEPDPDQELLLSALRAAGLAPALLPWDDPAAAPPGRFALCVLRSCWNYFEAPERFLGWCERAAAGSRLLNPLSVVRWNLHKRYLGELEAAGVPVVPTRLLAQGARADLGALPGVPGWGAVVVKPAVSAASFSTRRFPSAGAAAASGFLAELLARRDVLVQPYLRSVEGSGERAVVWIDGEITHVVRKSPRFTGEDERVTDGRPATAAERAVAEAAVGHVLRHVESGLAYARVDLMEDDAGRLRVSELELMEPSLFLVQSETALARLVAVLARHARAAETARRRRA